MTHKLTVKQNMDEEVKKRRPITLKTTTNDDEERDGLKDSDEYGEMALFTKKFRWFMMKKKQSFKKKPYKGEPSKEIEKEKENKVPACYECKKLGYYRSKYP